MADPGGTNTVATGGGTPGGSSGQVQYNNAGAFGGMAGTSWDDTNKVLVFASDTFTLKFGTSSDVVVQRDAAGIWAQRNSTNAQTLRVYNTYTDATTNEYGALDWTTTANTLTIGAFAGSVGGTLRSVHVVGGHSASYLALGVNQNSELRAASSVVLTVNAASAAKSGLIVYASDYVGIGNSQDVGIARNAAGVLEINDAVTPGTFRDILVRAARHTALTIATLPTGVAGMVAYVTDGDASLAWGATAVNSGAGATKYLVWYNGTNWTVAGK